MKPAYEIIKEMRIKNGISQKALADKIGTSQQAVALLENGKRKIEFDLFVKIMEILNESLLDIFINIGISENDLETKLGNTVISDLDTSLDNFLEAHGAFIYFDENNNYTIKYNNKTVKLTNDEYLKFRDNINSFIEYSLNRLISKPSTE